MTEDGRLGTAEVEALRNAAARLRENVGRVIVGKDDAIDLVLVALLCEGHVLLEDVPGIGKTVMAKAFARSLGCSFRRIQFTPDLMPSDITGINFYNQQSGRFEFREGPICSQVVLADEINRATPRTQSALLEAMEERQLTVEGVTTVLPRPFLVLGTQNPIELEGTFPLPEAQLDRFLLRLKLGYPSEEEEDMILSRFAAARPLEELAPVVEANELLALAASLERMYLDADVRRYIVRVVQATRSHSAFELGASPRASLALMRASRAWAAIQGRNYVLPDDVKLLAPHVLSHRLLLSPQARIRGRTVDAVVQEAVEGVAAPVEA